MLTTAVRAAWLVGFFKDTVIDMLDPASSGAILEKSRAADMLPSKHMH